MSGDFCQVTYTKTDDPSQKISASGYIIVNVGGTRPQQRQKQEDGVSWSSQCYSLFQVQNNAANTTWGGRR